MNLLRKVWFRMIISLLGGGAITELIHISTGDPNRPMTSNNSVFYGLIIFIVLTLIVRKKDRKQG